jgi:hypothetical protein
VPLNQPASISSFLAQIDSLGQDRQKAAPMLFADIENDVDDKQKFLVKQAESVEQMVDMYSTLLIKLNVFMNADKLLRPFG